MAYATFADFERYLEKFGTRYYGVFDEPTGVVVIGTTAWQADVDAAFDRVNNMLDSISRIPIIPVGTSVRTGNYNPYLVEWNTVDAIYHKLVARHVTEFGLNGLPQWIQDFGSRSIQIYDNLLNEKIILDTDTSFRGIGYPIRGSVAGNGTFFSNWDSGYYRASDFPKTYRFKISATTEGNAIGQAKYQTSEDDGYSWLPDETPTGTSWIDVADGLTIRWQPYGTGNQCNLGDWWKITCKPVSIRATGQPSKVKTFPRG